MNKLLSLIIIALLLVVGYLLLVKPESNTPTVSQETQTETSSEPSPENDEEVVTTEEPSEEAEPVATEETGDFCADLKAGIPGSSGFHITIDVASGETVADESEIKGCVYSIDGSYGTWGPFEGQVATYELKASDGTLLGEGFFETIDPDWLTQALASEDIPYATELAFDPLTYVAGTLIVTNENPSGESGLSSSFTVPVTF